MKATAYFDAIAAPVLVATDVTYCVTHGATDHDDGRAWTACRFRQLFYFENPMDEERPRGGEPVGGSTAP